jgi:hypothetical protein
MTVCCSCNKPTSGGHRCKIFDKPCHAIELCSVSCGEEGFGSKVICSECFINVEDVDENNEVIHEDRKMKQVKRP